ncbi:MAG: insulinase family protein [Candidatus Latescibacteria bacterium]|nr:insulinase family protein [Candidatus Latescibacterota bacterium]
MISDNVRKTVLPNGLRILTEQVPHVRSVSLGVWVEVGSRDEYFPHRGIIHFIEHMLFKGTAHRTAFDIAYSLESVGGQLDAFTGRDVTCFFARCLDEHVGLALEVLGDMLAHSDFDPEAMEREKGVVLEEIRNVEDTPDDLIHDVVGKSVWGDHPLGSPILGAQETVEGFRREDLIQHMQEFYTSGNIVVAAAGSLEHEAFVDAVARAIALPASQRFPRPRSVPPVYPGRSQHVDKQIGQTHVCLGASAFSYNDRRRFDLLAANTILGGGMSSRLFQEVRERLGLAYSIYSYVEMLGDTGLFGAYLACEEAQAYRSTALVCDEMRRIKTEGVTQVEVENAKAQLKGGLVIGLEGMSKRMSRLAKQEVYFGSYQTVSDALAEIDTVTREGVVEVCRSIFDPERFHLVTVGPEADGVSKALERI